MRRPRGFTLLEIMVAITIVSIVVMFVYQILQNSVRGQDMLRTDLRSPKIQNAILAQIVRDFRYLYWDGFSGNTGFFGRRRDVGGKRGDVIDFVTCRPSRTAQMHDDTAPDDVASAITEVGYACRVNEENSDWLELWRREDWAVDDDPLKGGKYSLVYDKIRKFSLLYFPIPEENVDGQGQEEWDSRAKAKLPYAIVLEIEFDVEEPTDRKGEDAAERISRIIILKAAYNVRPPDPPGQGTPNPN